MLCHRSHANAIRLPVPLILLAPQFLLSSFTLRPEAAIDDHVADIHNEDGHNDQNEDQDGVGRQVLVLDRRQLRVLVRHR